MSNDDRELIEARALFEIARPCFHYAKRGTGDGGAFEASETGRQLMKAMKAVAADLATRLEALQAQPVGEESGWLVEMVEPDHNKSPVPRWWHPEHGWMWDANKALRFAREIDAQDYIIGSGRLPGKPTEHMFLDSVGGEA